MAILMVIFALVILIYTSFGLVLILGLGKLLLNIATLLFSTFYGWIFVAFIYNLMSR